MSTVVVTLKERDSNGKFIEKAYPNALFGTDKIHDGHFHMTKELWIRREEGNSQNKTVTILAVFPEGSYLHVEVREDAKKKPATN